LNVIQTALYKLAFQGNVSLEQAKIIHSLYTKKCLSQHSIKEQTGLTPETIAIELYDLVEKTIVSEKGGIYYCENAIEKISEMIKEEHQETNEKKHQCLEIETVK